MQMLLGYRIPTMPEIRLMALRVLLLHVWIDGKAAQLGWHTGTVRVGEVQPAPVPAKPAPTAGFTRTRTVNPWVFGNTTGTCKPVQVHHSFLIFS